MSEMMLLTRKRFECHKSFINHIMSDFGIDLLFFFSFRRILNRFILFIKLNSQNRTATDELRWSRRTFSFHSYVFASYSICACVWVFVRAIYGVSHHSRCMVIFNVCSLSLSLDLLLLLLLNIPFSDFFSKLMSLYEQIFTIETYTGCSIHDQPFSELNNFFFFN